MKKPYQSVLVIDDHKMIINGIRVTIENMFEHFYEAYTGESGVALALQHQPQLVIVDFRLPDIEGNMVVKEIKYKCPESRVLAYSFNFDENAVTRMFSVGVNGYVLKSEDDGEFLKAIELIMSGREYYCREARNHIINRISFQDDNTRLLIADMEFTSKEVEIIRLTCYQKTAREISDQVYLSERTVEQYRSNINKRIGARNLVGVIKFALKNGLIRIEEL